jgi:2Fe-2S ferredoxin
MNYRITFLPENITVDAEEEDTVLEAARANGIPLEHNCGGNCSCTTCHVIVRDGEGNLSHMEEEEEDRLEECEELTPTSRLGCQARITGDLTIEIPERDPFKLDGLMELEEFGEQLLGSDL